MTDDTLTGLSPPHPSPSTALSAIAALADIPEEEIWLAKQKSPRTRRAYKLDVQHFIRTLLIKSYDELRQVDHRAVIAWERIMRETEEVEPSTVRRRLAALSSLFKHLKRHHTLRATRSLKSSAPQSTGGRAQRSPSLKPMPRNFLTRRRKTRLKDCAIVRFCQWGCR